MFQQIINKNKGFAPLTKVIGPEKTKLVSQSIWTLPNVFIHHQKMLRAIEIKLTNFLTIILHVLSSKTTLQLTCTLK